MQPLKFITLPGLYTLCKLKNNEPLPSWIFDSAFYTISKSETELSVVCESQYVIAAIHISDHWKLLRIDAVLDLSLTGITAKFSQPLADAGINLYVIATFDTDYIMVKEEKLSLAKEALENAEFIVE